MFVHLYRSLNNAIRIDNNNTIIIYFYMGIYTNLDIFGISIDDISITLFTKKYDTIMTKEQMEEVFLFYTELPDKSNLSFRLYTECSSTHDLQSKKNMTWYPISRNQFLEKFGV